MLSNRRMLLVHGVLMLAVLLFFVAPAYAQRMEGTFFAELGGTQQEWTNTLLGGGGSGWGATAPGAWLEYGEQTGSPQTAMVDPQGVTERIPRWWNQWFYDGKLDLTRWKIVDIKFDVVRLQPGPAFGMVYFNWSTDLYPEGTGGPPLTDFDPSTGAPWVGRMMYATFEVPEGEVLHYDSGGIRLPIPWNPEWVSVDVRGYNVGIVNGVLVHECVPEPGGLMAMFTGLCGLGAFMWRRKK